MISVKMRDGKNLAVIFIALAALVNQFANVSSSASAPEIPVRRVINTENSVDTNIKTNKLAETANRVDFVYSSNSFKEIEHDVLQFTGNVSNIRFSCQSTKNKTAFVGWNYHGIKEIEKKKSGDDENGYVINLSSGPPVVRMECYSLENKTITNSTWIYTGEDKPPYLYNNQKTIRASVLNRTTAFLSCLLKYPLDDNGNGKELQLFKDEERVDNDAFCLGYTPELGFLLNLTKLENYLGTYKCKVENSTPDDVVYVQFDKDAFVRVSYKGYLEQFYAESPKQHSFNCELPKEMFENDFKWYYQWKNGTHSPLNDKYVENVSSVGTFDYSQTVKVQFNYSDVAGIVCVGTAKGSGSQYNSSVLVHVKSPQKINIWKAERNGYDLTCYASGDPIRWKWKKNGKYLTLSDPEDQFDLLNHYSSTLTMKSIPAADSTAVIYTCIAENFLGSENNSFSVQDSGIKYMRRRLPPRFVKWFIQGEKLEEIGELQPYASLKFNPKRCIKYKDLIFGRKIKSGNFGTVLIGWVKENDSQQNHTQTPVAIKMMKYDPKASEEENIKNFCSFLAEIKKMQHMDYHRYVVNNAYLVVDYCRGGDLESYLKQFNRSNNDFCFHDDIQISTKCCNTVQGPKLLKTSHLMRWARIYC
ncbi:Platelet-derived growth factor receptor beta [Orchesella cincta]|uniref:Platelet-derived growth factor receptor beta n=1 Tax=Orchesella cincta TaxID=48709 RepID=A0A1D2MKT7_ORCCI|nr:Platelet-derived growth factor receptor beta [Orchesella cincta]